MSETTPDTPDEEAHREAMRAEQIKRLQIRSQAAKRARRSQARSLKAKKTGAPGEI